MKIFKDKQTLQKEILKTKGISFVPTMGGLHKGHISLIKKSKKSQFKTLVSIFVNPTQFNKKSDFRSYPRSTKIDLKKLKKLKINYVYIPTFKDIYGFKPKEKVFLDKFSKKLCGRFRRGHFEGVLNVVNRFLEIIKPKYIFLGKKDYQQLYLIKKHIENVEIPKQKKQISFSFIVMAPFVFVAIFIDYKPSVSSSPSAILRFWTAAPLAPFPKLSNRAHSKTCSASSLSKTKLSLSQPSCSSGIESATCEYSEGWISSGDSPLR